MKVKNGFLDTVRFAADNGAGSGAPPAGADPAPAGDAAPDPLVTSLIEAGKAGAARMRPPDDGDSDAGDGALPAEITGAPAAPPPPPEDEGEEGGETVAEETPKETPPAAPGADPGTAEALRKITVTVKGKDGAAREVELTEADVLSLAEGYEEYHSGHETFLKEKAALETERKAFDERLKGPDGVIIAALDKYPQLAEGLQKLIDEIPELRGEVDSSTLQKTVQELQAEIKALKEGREQDKTEAQKERERLATEERAKADKAFQDKAAEMRAGVFEKAKGAGIPERVANRIIDAAVAGLAQRKIEATPEAVQKFLDDELAAEIQDRKGLSEAATREYLNKKRAVPPAPPRGGNTPPPARKPPTTFGADLRRAVHSKLQALGGVRR